MSLKTAWRICAWRMLGAAVVAIVSVPDRLLGTEPRGLIWDEPVCAVKDLEEWERDLA